MIFVVDIAGAPRQNPIEKSGDQDEKCCEAKQGENGRHCVVNERQHMRHSMVGALSSLRR